jgi:hypothetical protein
MNDFPSSSGTVATDSRPLYEHGTIPMVDHLALLESAFTPRCYRCEATEDLQYLAVGARAGQYICVKCLDEALRGMDGD